MSIKTLLCGAAAVLAVHGHALAAEEAPMADGVDWTGAYVGILAGYADTDADWHFPILDPNNVLQLSPNATGALGGVAVGYNRQFERLVLGVEADMALTNVDGSVVCPNANYNCQVDMDWFATARVRAGVPVNRALIYATGGLAAARVVGQFEQTSNVGIILGPGSIGSDGYETQWGWTAGGGVEVAVRDNVSLRGEALYFDLGSKNYLQSTGNTYVNLGLDGYQVRAALVFQWP